MKRSWYPTIILSVVIGLLTVFLGLQYRWLSEVGEAERDRMQKRVETDAKRFAEDFNREMQSAYFNFQTSADVWKLAAWNEFNERYDFWKGKTQYPELIREFYFVEKADGKPPLKYDREKRAFEASELSPELVTLLPLVREENSFRPFYEDLSALALPIYNDERRVDHIVVRRSPEKERAVVKLPEKFGWLVVLLDKTVITDRLLPDLASKYFPEGDYKLSVTGANEQVVYATQEATSQPDASARLFDLSPDSLMFFGSREMIPKIAAQHRQGIVVNQRVESHTFTRTTKGPGGETGTFEVEMKEGPGALPRTATLTATTAAGPNPWTLTVQHASGSIDAFVRNQRNKSFLIGLGIYLLLVGSITAILLSAMKSKMFAQRQIDFVSSVSHEFRTPLAVIYSAGENLADGVAKEDRQVARYGELIKGEGKKLSAMVEQILEFAGANSGKRNFSFASTDVRELVRDALKECRPLIEAGGFTVEETIAEGLPAISADRVALSSAIQNLIANSVKYSNGSKWIRVSAANGGGAVRIIVEDRGIGIAGDELKRIFEPFYRTKEVVDSQISGNGLGLNLVRKIVEAHGGKVRAESRPGKGSTFTIEIPV